MFQNLCDFCKEIIHNKFYVFLIGKIDMKELIREYEQEFQQLSKDFSEFYEALRGGQKQARPRREELMRYSVCEECYKLFAHFLNMRKKDLLKTRETVKRLLELEAKEKDEK